MADVDTGGGGGGKHKGGPKQKKKSTRIDMTAMVDVAFLLLTFFILTTTLATPKAMKISKPPKNKEEEPNDKEVKQSKIMTFILGENDKVHYYQGLPEGELSTTDFGANGLRKVINEHLNKEPNRCPPGTKDVSNCWDPIFVVKPNKTCVYKNVVDVLDEMRITGATKFALTEPNAQDSILMLDNNKR